MDKHCFQRHSIPLLNQACVVINKMPLLTLSENLLSLENKEQSSGHLALLAEQTSLSITQTLCITMTGEKAFKSHLDPNLSFSIH